MSRPPSCPYIFHQALASELRVRKSKGKTERRYNILGNTKQFRKKKMYIYKYATFIHTHLMKKNSLCTHASIIYLVHSCFAPKPEDSISECEKVVLGNVKKLRV